MARPKEKVLSSQAFQQKCLADSEKQKKFQAESLAADIERMITEGLHMNLMMGSNKDVGIFHRILLKARNTESLLDLREPENGPLSEESISTGETKTSCIPSSTKSCDCDINKTVACGNENGEPLTEIKDSGLNLNQHQTEARSPCIKCNGSILTNDTVEDSRIFDKENGTNDKIVDTKIKQNGRDPDFRLSLDQLLDQEYGIQAKVSPCSTLGEDLLYLWLEKLHCDCVVEVNGERFPAHRCILSARSPYFAAMLCGSWQESDMETIVLNGLDGSVVCQLLLYLYGGVVDIIDTCPLGSLMQLADMYSMDGLKEMVTFNLNMEYCHFFHKPCPECISGVPESLALSMMFNLESLRDKCLRWIDKHKLKVWETKTFATLPPEVLELCVKSAVKDLTVDTVIDTLVECGQLNRKLPKLRWTEVIFHMVTSLMDAAIEYSSTKFVRLLSSHKLEKLDKRGLPFNRQPIEEIFSQIIGALSPEMSCQAYILLHQYVEAMNKRDEDPKSVIVAPFSEECESLVRTLNKRCKDHMCTYIHQVAHTADWDLLTKDQQSEILSEANYVCFDTNKGKMSKPKLTSMQKKPQSSSGMSLTEYLKCWFEPKTQAQATKSATKSSKKEASVQKTKSSWQSKPTGKSVSSSTPMNKNQKQTTGSANEPKVKNRMKGKLLYPKETGSEEKLWKSSIESLDSTGSGRKDVSFNGKVGKTGKMPGTSIDRFSINMIDLEEVYKPLDIRNFADVQLVDLPSPIQFLREKLIPIYSVKFWSP